MADLDSPVVFQSNLTQMLNGCPHLESLQLTIRGSLVDATAFQSLRFSLPETLKSLRLQPLLESEAILHMNRFIVAGSCLSKADYSALLSHSPSFTLQILSFVLDLISDRLSIAITASLPQLVKLDLEVRPEKEPLLNFSRLRFPNPKTKFACLLHCNSMMLEALVTKKISAIQRIDANGRITSCEQRNL